MTKEDFVRLYIQIDNAKFEMLEQGVAFLFMVKDGSAHMCTGIGDGADMTDLSLNMIHSLYMATGGSISVEEFANSVKDNYLRHIMPECLSMRE